MAAIPETEIMTRIVIACAAAGLSMLPALLLAQTPPGGRGNAAATRRSFEKSRSKDNPSTGDRQNWIATIPFFLAKRVRPITRRWTSQSRPSPTAWTSPGPSRSCPADVFSSPKSRAASASSIKDGSTLHSITANPPPVYFRRQAVLLDVALDRNFASNHRIFFVYMRIIDAESCVQAVDSATLNEDAGTLADVNTIFQGTPFTNRAVSQTGARIAIDPKDGNLFVAIGDRSTGDPIPLQAQQTDKYLGKVIHITPEGKAAPGNPSIGLPDVWTMGHRTPQGLTFAPDGRLWETEHGPRGGDELNLIEKGKNYGWPVIVHGINYPG